MIVSMRYNPTNRTADIINTTTGQTLKTNVPLRDVPDVLAKLRHALATARKAGK